MKKVPHAEDLASQLPRSLARISVVMPCYNAERFVRAAVESAISQTRKPFEIIVVDDGSTDQSMKQLSDLPITMVRTSGRTGEANARNVGINLATGEYIATLDADDVWMPNHLEFVAALLDRFADVAVACGGVAILGDDTISYLPTFVAQLPVEPIAELVRGCPIPHPATLIRRSMLLEAGCYSTDSAINFSPDFALWIQLAKQHKFAHTGMPTVHYRVHDGQLSRSRDKQLASSFEVRSRLPSSDYTVDTDIAFCDAWRSQVQQAWWSRDFKSLRVLNGFATRSSRLKSSERERWKLVARLGPFAAWAWEKLPLRWRALMRS